MSIWVPECQRVLGSLGYTIQYKYSGFCFRIICAGGRNSLQVSIWSGDKLISQIVDKLINQIVGFIYPLKGWVPYWKWDGHSLYSDFWPWIILMFPVCGFTVSPAILPARVLWQIRFWGRGVFFWNLGCQTKPRRFFQCQPTQKKIGVCFFGIPIS